MQKAEIVAGEAGKKQETENAREGVSLIQKAETVAGEAGKKQGTETAREGVALMQKAETVAGEAEKDQETQTAAADRTDDVTTQLPHPLTVIVNHTPITMQGKASYVFVDVFDYIDFDLGTSASAGRSIVTNLNGRPAQYMEPLSEGDVIEIYWKNMR